jgi:hypothetical protein
MPAWSRIADDPQATVIALQAVLLAVAVWEVRGAAVANFVAAALLAASLATLCPPTTSGARLWGRRVLMIAPALMLTPLLLEIVGNSVAHAVQPIAHTSPQDPSLTNTQCRNVSSFSALNALPAGRTIALIDAGAAILLQTPHTVLAAPYHRNNDGNRAVVEAFLAPPAEAYAGLIAHDIDYVVTCAGAPEVRHYKRLAPDGLAAQLARNIVPKYLEQIPLGTVRCRPIVSFAKDDPREPRPAEDAEDLLRRQHHHHLTAFEARVLLDLGESCDVGLDAIQQARADLLVRHFASAIAQGDLHLVAFLEEALHRLHLHVIVVIVDHRTELDLLDLDDLLALARFGRLLLRGIFELPVIEKFADRRIGVR